MKQEKFEALHGELMDAARREMTDEERSRRIRWILQRYLRVFKRGQWTLLFVRPKTGNADATLS